MPSTSKLQPNWKLTDKRKIRQLFNNYLLRHLKFSIVGEQVIISRKNPVVGFAGNMLPITTFLLWLSYFLRGYTTTSKPMSSAQAPQIFSSWRGKNPVVGCAGNILPITTFLLWLSYFLRVYTITSKPMSSAQALKFSIVGEQIIISRKNPVVG